MRLFALASRGACLLGVLAMAVASACAKIPDTSAVTEVVGPDYLQFKGVPDDGGTLGATQAGVSRVLERRCGTLDCHGQVGRPLRIYGQFGLRFVDDAGNVSGMAATTETEYQANYQSVIGLQPELMSEVVQQQNPPESLLLMRKPLQLERHKGGMVFQGGDVAYICLTSWLAGQANFTACATAAQ